MIVAYESPEKRAEVATGFRGNDLVVAHNGGIYVTDPFETPNNSKVYYIITDGAGSGEQVFRFPVTGSETVLDAISQIGGLPPVSSKGL